MKPRGIDYDDLDPLERDDIDLAWIEVTTIHAVVDIESESCHYVEDDHPICPYDIGDDEGLCVRDTCGCHIEGCEYAQ